MHKNLINYDYYFDELARKHKPVWLGFGTCKDDMRFFYFPMERCHKEVPQILRKKIAKEQIDGIVSDLEEQHDFMYPVSGNIMVAGGKCFRNELRTKRYCGCGHVNIENLARGKIGESHDFIQEIKDCF